MVDLGAGKYQIIAPIASGGMAEVFVAQSQGVQGFVKRVAIKRVLPHLAGEHEFVHMFLDEARVAVELAHANIVQVLDLGMADQSYFIVMEYVDGCDLRSVLHAGVKAQTPPPIPLSLFIAIEALKGLEHAHAKRDATGHPLGIVHRDVSPPNILLSWSGEVKVADFGIAKAAMQIQLTDPGALKGKYSYMSPEQASGLPVDGRSDVFAMGVVLWEMITGNRLFKGANNFETLERVKGIEAPLLHAVRADVPPELSAIVAHSLAKPLNDRFPTAAAMGEELAEFLYAKGWKVTATDLAAYLEFLFPPEGRKERDAERALRPPPPAPEAAPSPSPAMAPENAPAAPFASPQGQRFAPSPNILPPQGRANRNDANGLASPANPVVELVPVVTADGVVMLPADQKNRVASLPLDRESLNGVEDVPSDRWATAPQTQNVPFMRPMSSGALELDDRRAPKRRAARTPETTPGYSVTYRTRGPGVETRAPASSLDMVGPLKVIIKFVLLAAVIYGAYRLYLVASEANVQGESRIIVLSDPPGAQVFLNGMAVGATPLDAKNPLKEPRVHVRIAKAGYKSFDDYVTAMARNNLRVEVKLLFADLPNRDRGR